MQKSAHIASLATRLNNLEQKVDALPEGEGGGGGGGSDVDMQRLIRAMMLDAGTSAVMPGNIVEEVYYFDINTSKSLAGSVFGSYHHNPTNYTSCNRVSFFSQTLAGYGGYFSFYDAYPNTRSLAGAIFAGGYEDYFADTTKRSLSESVFSSPAAVEYCQTAAGGRGLFAKIFGSEASRFNRMQTVHGSDLSSDNKNLLDLLVTLRSEINSLKNRVAYLESRL